MEYVSGGELFYHLTKTRGFGEERSRFYSAEITLAIGFLHQHNIVYRDLKVVRPAVMISWEGAAHHLAQVVGTNLGLSSTCAATSYVKHYSKAVGPFCNDIHS